MLSGHIHSAQVNFHTTLSGEAMVTMLYHKRLGPKWEGAAGTLRAHILAARAEACSELTLAGRSRGQKLTLGAGHVTERLRVAGRQLLYRQVSGCWCGCRVHIMPLSMAGSGRARPAHRAS